MQNTSLDPESKDHSVKLPFQPDESSITEWLRNLPVGEKVELCKTVFAALQNLNRQAIDGQTRFALLEKLRTIVFLESANLAAKTKDAVFPLEQKARKWAKLAAKFHTELAAGYQMIVDHEQFEEVFTDSQKAQVLHRILRSIEISILRTAQLYEPPSSRAWANLKKMYKYAATRQLLKIRVSDPIMTSPEAPTLENTLGALILFSVVNPYRFTQLEMERIFKIFDLQSESIEWKTEHSDPSYSVFGIDLDNALPPQHRSTYARTRKKALECIDTTRFTTALINYYLNAGAKQLELSQASLLILQHHLGNPKPVQIRNIGNDTEITLGLENVSNWLQLETSKPSSKLVAPLEDWLNTPNYELLPLREDGFDEHSTRPVFSRSRPAESARGNSPAPKNRQCQNPSQLQIGSSTFHCEVHPSELPGHVLVESKTDSLAIGQVIAFRDPSSRIEVGIIRWIQENAYARCYYYGIERLLGKCILADVVIANSKLNRVLLLEKTRNEDSIFSLIMPPARYKSGTRLTVRHPKFTKNFLIERLLETNLFYCHFSLRLIS